MSDNRAGVGSVDGGYSSEELQEWSGVFGNAVVWPRYVLKLLDFSAVRVTHLETKAYIGCLEEGGGRGGGNWDSH